MGGSAKRQCAAVRNTVGSMRLPVHNPSRLPSAAKSKRRAPTAPKSVPVGTPLVMNCGPVGYEPVGAEGSLHAMAAAEITARRIKVVLRIYHLLRGHGPVQNACQRACGRSAEEVG
jgi:hypothetical protein